MKLNSKSIVIFSIAALLAVMLSAIPLTGLAMALNQGDKQFLTNTDFLQIIGFISTCEI